MKWLVVGASKPYPGFTVFRLCFKAENQVLFQAQPVREAQANRPSPLWTELN